MIKFLLNIIRDIFSVWRELVDLCSTPDVPADKTSEADIDPAIESDIERIAHEKPAQE